MNIYHRVGSVYTYIYFAVSETAGKTAFMRNCYAGYI